MSNTSTWGWHSVVGDGESLSRGSDWFSLGLAATCRVNLGGNWEAADGQELQGSK